MEETLYSILEWLAVICNLLFVILIIGENRSGWIWGILGSALSIILFLSVKLYSESILYFFYVLMGFYGWYIWGNTKGRQLPISEWPLLKHVIAVAVFICASVGLGFLFKNHSDAELPFADAVSTSFSFLATYLEAKKVLSAWVYWFALNTFSVWLYFSRGLNVYALLMVVYSVLSIIGYMQWRKKYLQESTG